MTNVPRNLASRRSFVGMAAIGSLLLATGRTSAGAPASIMVWKDPNCGCCGKWVAHLRENGFTVAVFDHDDMPSVKVSRGVPPELASCHTAEISGYIVEGHVPAHAIKRLLMERPAGRGISVPGMPIGSPGMEGGTPEPYEVLLFGRDEPTRFGRYIGASPA
jgi:hypothetical protein